MFHNSSSKSLMHAGRTCKRLHGLVCDREVWVHLLQGIENFSMEKVDELARFGSNRSPEMKAEVLKAAASKMKVSDHRCINIKVSVKGWGDTPDTFDVDGEAMEKFTRVAFEVEASFNIVEVWCRRSISDSSTASLLTGVANHVQRQGDKMESLELLGLPRKCKGMRKQLFFNLLNLSKKWKILYLDWFLHGSYLAGLSGDTNINTGWCQLEMLFLGQSIYTV